MEWFHEFTEQVAAAVAAKLVPKFEAAVGKMEAAVSKIEAIGRKVDTLTGKVDAIRDKLDHLAGGGLTPAQMKTLMDLTARLRVSAATLKAVVALNSPPT